eukprot:GHVN01023701.1.p1 GENE.GHVN01023701.1~~GHVN01023701.1.p1  ORF type:complete len:626 (+),score=73.16 GHVN01023701.1:45-1922(+)
MYQIVKLIASVVCDAYFKEVSIVNGEKVPLYGPVIFVGNHTNQFVDAAMLIRNIPRTIRFLIADVSLKKFILGNLAKASGCLPVKRAQDGVFSGLGKVTWEKGSDIVRGDELCCNFKLDVKPGFTIMPAGCKKGMVVKAVNSNSELLLTAPTTEDPADQKKLSLNAAPEQDTTPDAKINTGTGSGENERPLKIEEDDCAWLPYRIMPKVNQSEIYDEVSATLGAGGAIGVFPEGGSHDRSDLLPLKPGVAIMALAAACEGADVLIVPVGLHYHAAHKVQSRAVLEYGNPIGITEDQVYDYRYGDSRKKRETVAELLERVETGLRSCCITARDEATLKDVKLCVTLYPPERQRLTVDKQFMLKQLFSEFFRQLEDKEDVQKFRLRLAAYRKLLEESEIPDHEVWLLKQSEKGALVAIFLRFLQLVKACVFGLPPSLLWGPLRMITHKMAETARIKALNASQVKVQAQDVFASYRILASLAIIPLANLMYGVGIAWFMSSGFFGLIFWMIVAAFGLPVMYYHSLRNFEMIRPLFRQISIISTVLVNWVWCDSGNDLITDRMEMQLALRKLVGEFASTDAAIQMGFIKQLEAIVPEFVMAADTNRLRNREEDYISSQRFTYETREEIL